MLKLKEKIFGEQGYSSDFKLTDDELEVFRKQINDHWLATISHAYPELYEEARKLGIQNYHLIADKMDHQKLWHKSKRVLPQESVNVIKKLPFISILKNEFGDFTISDVYDTEQRYGHEEIYWRLVRPNELTDVGPLHKDIWFHGAANSGYGMFAEDEVTVKIWIPVYCEKGKSGLKLLARSHLINWEYTVEMIDGMARPTPIEDLSNVGATLMPTEPGNLLIFNEGILHGGALNQSDKTRVSAEITLVLKQPSRNR